MADPRDKPEDDDVVVEGDPMWAGAFADWQVS